MRVRRWRTSARGLLESIAPTSLSHVALLPQEDPDVVARRRRVVTGTALTGAGLLGAGLAAPPNSRAFYGFTFSVAGTYLAGGMASGPLHLGWIQMRDTSLRRPIVTPVATGVAAFGVFYLGGLVAKQIPVLDRAITKVMAFAEEGDDRLVLLTTLTNGLAEEVFFRGALYSALPHDHALKGSTAIYALATTTTRNPALVLAAGLMGTLFGYQRRATGGLQAPALTHVTWSTLMLRFMPRLFSQPAAPQLRADRPN